jgi:hypothetical protein
MSCGGMTIPLFAITFYHGKTMAWKTLRLQGNQLSRVENLQGNFRIREVGDAELDTSGVTVDFPNRNSTFMGNL